MAPRTTLTAQNLESLGAERLAQLLMTLSEGRADAKRALRLELASIEGPRKLASEVRKRLRAIHRSQAFIEWHGIKALVSDLETQRRTIADQVAISDPIDAYDLMWDFLGLAEAIFSRTDDGSGRVIEVFHQACSDLGRIAQQAKPDPVTLAGRIVEAKLENGYGQFDGLIPSLTPALGTVGLSELKTRFTELGAEARPTEPSSKRKVIGLSTNGPIYEDDFREQSRRQVIRSGLKEVADALGDVDAYIAQEAHYAHVPAIAAEIGKRLLKARRFDEALAAVDAVGKETNAYIPIDWELTRLEALEALGRNDEAQAFRMGCFHRSLNADHLRAYLKRLPDFEDVEAEEEAIAYAQAFESVHHALHFLLQWPALNAVAQLVLERHAELDGNHYEILTSAAEKLELKYPLAATIALRKMIDFALETARAKRYPHAARHLAECRSLAKRIDAFDTFDSHDAYVDQLKLNHPKKSGFWNLCA